MVFVLRNRQYKRETPVLIIKTIGHLESSTGDRLNNTRCPKSVLIFVLDTLEKNCKYRKDAHFRLLKQLNLIESDQCVGVEIMTEIFMDSLVSKRFKTS